MATRDGAHTIGKAHKEEENRPNLDKVALLPNIAEYLPGSLEHMLIHLNGRFIEGKTSFLLQKLISKSASAAFTEHKICGKQVKTYFILSSVLFGRIFFPIS